MGGASRRLQVLSPTNHREMLPAPFYPQFPKRNRRLVRHHHNFHVFYILPVTTFRTIDLEGKKNSSPLFSRFCEEESVFLGVRRELRIKIRGETIFVPLSRFSLD